MRAWPRCGRQGAARCWLQDGPTVSQGTGSGGSQAWDGLAPQVPSLSCRAPRVPNGRGVRGHRAPDPTCRASTPSTGSEHRLGPPHRRQKRQLPKGVAARLPGLQPGSPSTCQGPRQGQCHTQGQLCHPHLAGPGTFPVVQGVIPALGRQVGRWAGGWAAALCGPHGHPWPTRGLTPGLSKTLLPSGCPPAAVEGSDTQLAGPRGGRPPCLSL